MGKTDEVYYRNIRKDITIINGVKTISDVTKCVSGSKKERKTTKYFTTLTIDSNGNGIISGKTIIITGDECKEQEGTEIIPRGFANNTKELKTLVIPDTVRTINTSAFNKCNNLICVELPSSVTIKESCFANCKSLRYVYYDGDGEPSVRKKAFSKCPNFKGIRKSPDSSDNIIKAINEIEPSLNRYLSKLEEPIYKGQIGKIIIGGENLIYYCTKKYAIRIPKDVLKANEALLSAVLTYQKKRKSIVRDRYIE